MEATGNEHILMDRRYLVKAARCVLHHYHVMVKRLFSFNKSTSVNLYSVTSTRSIVDPTDGQCPGCFLSIQLQHAKWLVLVPLRKCVIHAMKLHPRASCIGCRLSTAQ